MHDPAPGNPNPAVAANPQAFVRHRSRLPNYCRESSLTMPIIEAINPRSGEIDYRVEATPPEAVARRARELRDAQTAWAADASARVRILNQWAGRLEAASGAIAEALTDDTGRRLLSYIEVNGMAQRIRYWTERFPALLDTGEGGRSRSAANVNYRHQLVPYTLVGVISPWNFPMTLSLVDAIPALCAGCAVLLKPSEVTPRFAQVLRETISGDPDLAAVFDIVIGAAETGTAVIDNVDMVCFTGSVATGRKVAVQAAQNFIPACLELGGKDPAIVLEDADVERAADAILRSAAGSCGQACMSIERIYVHESRFDELRDALVARAGTVDFNTPDIHRGSLPPFIDQRQAAKVAQQLEEALARGATLHSGGAPRNIDGGWWMAPTVVTDVSSDMLLMREETFGPVLPIIPFSSDTEALLLANDSDYGLSGSVFGEQDHALAVAAELEVGAVGINDASMTALIHDVEKQSFNLSGMGPSRMGDMGLMRFFRRKAMMIQNDPPATLAVLDEAGLPA